MHVNVHFVPIFFSAGGVNAWAGVLLKLQLMLDRTYSNIDHNVEETEEMRVYRMILITG